MIVDCHAHYVPESLFQAVNEVAGSFSSVEMTSAEGSHRFAFCGGTPTRPLAPKLIDLDRRRSWLAEQGIDRQVVGGWMDILGYELEPGEGTAWCRLLNAHQLAATADESAFVPLATVPMQDGRAAAEVLAEASTRAFQVP